MSERPDVVMLGMRSLGAGQGGVETHVSELTAELDRQGLSVEAVVRSPYAGKMTVNRDRATRIIPIWSPTNASAEAIVHSFLGLCYAAWRRPKLVHVHAIGPGLVTPLARLLGLRVVVTHHGEDYNREKWGPLARFLLRFGEKVIAIFANARICISPSLTKMLNSRYGQAFRYIPNGVRALQPIASAAALETFGLTPGKYVLHVGRMVPEKRQLDLIQAFREIDSPDFKLVLVGAADHESEYSQQVHEAAEADPRVVLAGFQTGTPLAELFSHARVFALPSSHEGLPIALLEAMAYELPVIASDIEANANLGLPDTCYFRVGEIADLHQALTDAIAGSPCRDWRDVLRKFDWTAIATETIATYEKATRTPMQPRRQASAPSKNVG